MTNNTLNNYNYSKVSEPEILNTTVHKRIKDVKCLTDNCLTNETKKILAFEYSVNKPPDCNDRILRLMSFIKIIVNHCSKYKKMLFEYDLVLDNLDINRGTSLQNAVKGNTKLKEFIDGIDNIETFNDKLKIVNDIVLKSDDMKSEVNHFKPESDTFDNNKEFLVDNIKQHFNNDKKILDALVTLQNAILNNTLSGSIKRLNFIGISNTPGRIDNKFVLIDTLLKGREEVKLNLV